MPTAIAVRTFCVLAGTSGVLRFCELRWGPGLGRSCLRTQLRQIAAPERGPRVQPRHQAPAGSRRLGTCGTQAREPCAGCERGATSSCRFSSLSSSSSCFSTSQRMDFPKSPDTGASGDRNPRTRTVSHQGPEAGLRPRPRSFHPLSCRLVLARKQI